jgi:hypothetical protein
MYVSARRVVGLVDAIFNRLNDDLASMEADTDPQIGIVKPRNCVLHGQSCQATANGMIFTRSWRPKKCHDAVTLYFVDDTVVAMNGILHKNEHRLQASHAQFRIP